MKTTSHCVVAQQRLALGVIFTALLTLAGGVQALRFEPSDDIVIDFDTTIAYGAMWRVEDQKEMSAQQFRTGPIINPADPQYNPATIGHEADPDHESRVIQWNSDDGNRNFEKGDLVSNRIAFTSDLDFQYGNYGFFLRSQIFYDSVYFEETSWDAEGWGDWVSENATQDCNGDGIFDTVAAGTCANSAVEGGDPLYHLFDGLGGYIGPESLNNVYASGFISNPSHFSQQVKEKHGYDARFLDAYIYGSFYLGDHILDLRLGRQAINWGEAIMLQGGIGYAQNRFDAAAATAPGVELKEIFLPTGSLYGQLDLTESLTLEAYWQYEWKEAELFEAGAYFGTTDMLGSNVMLRNDLFNSQCMFGFTETYNFADNNGVGGDKTCANGQEQTFVGVEHSAFQSRNIMWRSKDVTPDDPADQYGVALRMLFDGGSEAGIYFVQYHDTLPSVWALNNGADGGKGIYSQTNVGLFADPNWVGPPVSSANAQGVNGGRYTVEYKERIKLYGLSYNTVFGDVQMGFELAYRENQPVVPACTGEQILATTFDESIPDPSPIDVYGQWTKGMTASGPCKDASLKHWLASPQIWGFGAAEPMTAEFAEETAYRLFAWPTEAEVFTYNVGVTLVVPPTALWDTGILVAELGGFYVGSGFEDEDLKISDIGSFTQTGYGMSAIFLPMYKNVASGVDLTIPVYIKYGIDGSFAYFDYTEGSIWWSVGLEAIYLSNLSVGVLYSAFNSAHMWSDRDNVSFNVKYSF